ncbi:MAG: hypothetical protein M3155_03740 [Actinomycetota bacterium]|nr:hypothetical protein [Actinomycetota bacterium]
MLRPAAVALAAYAVWIGAFLAQGHDVRDFIRIGTLFVGRSHVSPDIRYDPHYRYPPNHDAPNGVGYDGQFSYYMALDFPRARHYMDDPPYRYGRVLYPGAAWALAAGQDGAIPATMLLVNWLAIGLGTLAIAAWLRRRGASEWWALAFGLYPGLFVGLQRDLTEPLAYALAALAVYLFDFGPGRRRVALAGAMFGVAALGRQTVAVFALCYLAAILLRGAGPLRARVRANWRPAAVFGALSLGPVVAYTAALWAWLGAIGSGKFLRPVPLLGLLDSGHWKLSRQPVEIWAVVLPGLLLGALAIALWRRGGGRLPAACLLANVVLFVLLLNVYRDGYTASGRATTGVVLAALVCVPHLRALPARMPRLLFAAVAIWATMLPVIAVYGLTDARV